jgi:hypothetical protein
MFIEGSFSWDKEAERTSLEWPPLMSPDGAEAPPRGRPEDEVVLGMDPDLMAGEPHARGLDGLVDAPFVAEDPRPPASGVAPAHEWQSAPIERRGADPWLDEALDETDDSENEGERPPRRHLSRRKGSLIALATAVTVALSGGYAAQAFGWRLPPALRDSAQPMREFLWSLAPSRLVGLMATQDRAARPLARDRHEGAGLTPDLAPPRPPAALSLAGSTAVPTETEQAVAVVPPSRSVDPADRQAGVDRDAPDSRGVATSTALAAGAAGRQPVGGESAATRSAPARPPTAGRAWDSSAAGGVPTATRAAPQPASRDRLVRAWHGFVWSPAAQGLVPAVPAAEDRSMGALPPAPGALPPAASGAVPVR